MAMRSIARQLLFPFRKALGRFVLLPEERTLTDSIVYKAAALVAAEKIRGDYLEFGVYRGDSFASAYRAIELAFRNATAPGPWNTQQDSVDREALWSEMRFFAFDSFEGLPELEKSDLDSNDFVEGKYRCSRDEFERRLAKRGVPGERVRVVQGWFDDTLDRSKASSYGLETAAIVYVDCDLYSSARIVLDFVEPFLVNGSVIIFDDWYCFRGSPNNGEQRACREWLEAHPELELIEYQKEGPWKNSFIVVRRGD